MSENRWFLRHALLVFDFGTLLDILKSHRHRGLWPALAKVSDRIMSHRYPPEKTFYIVRMGILRPESFRAETAICGA